MEELNEMLALDSLGELNWGLELFLVVTLTLLARVVALRLLRVMERQLAKTENTWDDALFEAARAPLSWFILIMGLLWAVDISEGYVDFELFSDRNLGVVRQLTFIVLVMLFFWRFISQGEQRLLEKIQAGGDPDPAGPGSGTAPVAGHGTATGQDRKHLGRCPV